MVSDTVKASVCLVARITQWLSALIAFSVLASVEDTNSGFHYSDFSSLQFVVAAGVLIWIYVSFILATILATMAGQEIFSVERMIKIELVGDVVTFLLFAYTGAVVISVWSTNLNDVDAVPSDDLDKVNATCAFMWFTTLAFLPPLYFHMQGGGAAEAAYPNNSSVQGPSGETDAVPAYPADSIPAKDGQPAVGEL